MSTISTNTPVIIGACGVQGSTGPIGYPGATGFVGVTGMAMPTFNYNFPIQIDYQRKRKAKKWWQRSYNLWLSWLDGKETGDVVITSFIDIFGFLLFSRTRKSADVPLIAVIVFDELPA